jgi:hypothetical protein
VSGTSSSFEASETSFHQDLNGDGVIGIPGAQLQAAQRDSFIATGNDTFVFRLDLGGLAVNGATADTNGAHEISSAIDKEYVAALLHEAQSGALLAALQATNGGHDTVVDPVNHDGGVNVHTLDQHAGFFIVH